MMLTQSDQSKFRAAADVSAGPGKVPSGVGEMPLKSHCLPSFTV